MKTPAHAMALEISLFEEMLSRRGMNSETSDMLGDFCANLKRTLWLLSAPEGELVLCPPPAYIFVMNEELCGVYPTPTGVYIRKPLECGEEVMVLQPGYHGTTTAAYYYHNSQLFVLCEDNRKLIIYDLAGSAGRPGVSSEVLGLPRLAACYTRKIDMVCNDNYIFILVATGHLFYITRMGIRDTVQAYLGWTTDGTTGRCRQLMLNSRSTCDVTVISVAFRSFTVIDLTLVQDRRWLGNPVLTESRMREEQRYGGFDDSLVTVIPIEPGLWGVIARSRWSVSKRRATIQLVDQCFRQLGTTKTLTEEYSEAYHMQIVNGPGNTAYVLRRDKSFAKDTFPYLRDDDGEPRLTSDGKHPYASDSIISDVGPDDPKRLTIYHYIRYHSSY